MEKYFVYLLLSLKDNRTYVGYTNCLEKRLSEHNNGKSKSTKHRIPLKLIYFEEYDSSKIAKKREKYSKTRSGRRELNEIFKNLNTKVT